MDHAKRGEKFIFVGGAPRSGTTMVQNILDSHPDIYGAPEFTHLRRILRIRKDLHSSILHERLADVCSHEEVDENIRVLIENFLFSIIKKHECRLLSEKTPQNAIIFPDLIELFPAARFIHVVRDPRAVIASMLQVRRRMVEKKQDVLPTLNHLQDCINLTQRCLKNAFAAGQSHPQKVLTVVYERLVHNVEEETKRICDFLKIRWSEGMMRPGDFRHPAEKAMTCEANAAWYDKKMFNRDPQTDSVDKWKRELTAAQQVTVAKAFENNEHLKQLGYDFSLGYLSQRKRIAGLIGAFVHRSDWAWRWRLDQFLGHR